MPKLVVLTKGKPREIEMGQELTIGRGYSNLLRLEGEEISRVHAIIYRRNNDFILRDLDSKNGVFVNGNKVSYAQLGPGDKLQVGKYKMVFDPPASEQEGDLIHSGKHPKVQVGSPDPAHDAGEYTSSGYGMNQSVPPSPLSPADEAEGHAESPPPSDWSREEVLFLTRDEWLKLKGSAHGETENKVAHLRNRFFENVPLYGHTGDPSLAQVLLTAVVQAVSADRGAVIVRDRTNGDLSSAAMVADQGDVAVNRIVLRSGLEDGKAILCPRTEDSGLFRENDTVVTDRISSLISVPLGEGRQAGLLYVDRIGDHDQFNIAELQMVVEVARLLELHLVELQSAESQKDAAQ